MFDFLKKFRSYGKIADYPVKLVDEFIFSVPVDYNHNKQIEAFLKYADKNHISYTNELSDKNFERTSYQLEPSKQYHARILRVGKDSRHYSYSESPGSPISYTHNQMIETSDCINFLERQNSMYTNSHFIGTQGLTYVWQFIEKENLEAEHPILSMDEARYIAKNDDRITTLFLGRWGNKEHASVKFTYDGRWYPGIYLLYVSKVTETTKQDLNEKGVRIHDNNKIVYTAEENDIKNRDTTSTLTEEYAKEESTEEIDLDKLETIDINYACKLLELGIDISSHLDKVVGEKSSRLALKIIEADTEFGAFHVADNISHFSNLNQEVAKKLAEKDEAYCIGENIDKFENLNQTMAECLIEHHEGDSVLENISKFSLMDESGLALKIIDHDLALGGFVMTPDFNKLTNLNEEVAIKLIESNEADSVIENIEKFSIKNDSKLALKIIDSDSDLGTFTVSENIDKFTNLNQKVAERLIENHESNPVLENISKFHIEDDSKLILKIINSDESYLIINNLDKFKNLSEGVVFEIIKNETYLNEYLTLSEELNSNLKSFTQKAQELINKKYPVTKK